MKSPKEQIEEARRRQIIDYFERNGIPAPFFEFEFLPGRKFRFDMAWVLYKVALEIEGGIYGSNGKRCKACKQPIGGAHRSVPGILRDIEKSNLAQLNGWIYMRVQPSLLFDFAKPILHVLKSRGYQ